MMMPANYSAIAENEMTYVAGGALVDTLAPLMNETNWKNFNTNIISIIGGSFAQQFVDETLGTMFGGEYVPGQVATTLWKKHVTNIWDKNYNSENKGFWNGAKGVLNVALQGVAGLATIYTMGQGTIGFNGVKTIKKSGKQY